MHPTLWFAQSKRAPCRSAYSSAVYKLRKLQAAMASLLSTQYSLGSRLSREQHSAFSLPTSISEYLHFEYLITNQFWQKKLPRYGFTISL
jgi:hypothetical protein